MPITVKSKRVSLARLKQAEPNAFIADVTSRGPDPWVRFSPFFPHVGIPVPLSPLATAASVEGIWQALKVFETAGVDRAKLDVTTMRGIKRTARALGRILGHRAGLTKAAGEAPLLGYVEARKALYLPAYLWVLEHKLAREVEALKRIAKDAPVILLDYETNGDVEDTAKPLSHAALVAHYAMGTWPV